MTVTATPETRAEFYDAKPRESRSTVGISVRSTTDDEATGEIIIEGYASTTDDPYVVRDWLGEYQEIIARGAFAKSLREQDDVRLLVNHEGIPLARTKSGTLTMRESTDPAADPQGANQTGLWTSSRLDASSPLAQQVKSAIERGDMTEMSFAFAATRQEWNEDYTERKVLEVRLYDVSVVTYPANPATSVSVASERTVTVTDTDTDRRLAHALAVAAARDVDAA